MKSIYNLAVWDVMGIVDMGKTGRSLTLIDYIAERGMGGGEAENDEI